MKFLALIAFIFLAFLGFSGKPYKIEVVIFNPEQKLPVEGAKVVFKTDKNYILFSTVTDKKGYAVFESCTEKLVKISAVSDDENYSSYYIYKKKVDFGIQVKIDLENFTDYRNKIKALTISSAIDSSYLKKAEACGVSLVEAEYPGGIPALTSFMVENMKYPERALEEGLSGKCYLRFYINQKGEISNIKISKSFAECPECDLEAVQLVDHMPNWIPASCNGENVGTYYDLPVSFITN